MSLWGWVFMVGFRVLDVALLGAWLFWFFRRLLDDDGEDDEDGREGFGTGPVPEPPPPGSPGARPWPARLRDHGDRDARRGRARRRPKVTSSN